MVGAFAFTTCNTQNYDSYLRVPGIFPFIRDHWLTMLTIRLLRAAGKAAILRSCGGRLTPPELGRTSEGGGLVDGRHRTDETGTHIIIGRHIACIQSDIGAKLCHTCQA